MLPSVALSKFNDAVLGGMIEQGHWASLAQLLALALLKSRTYPYTSKTTYKTPNNNPITDSESLPILFPPLQNNRNLTGSQSHQEFGLHHSIHILFPRLPWTKLDIQFPIAQ